MAGRRFGRNVEDNVEATPEGAENIESASAEVTTLSDAENAGQPVESPEGQGGSVEGEGGNASETRKVERKPVDTGTVETFNAATLDLTALKRRATKLEQHPLFTQVQSAELDSVRLSKLESADKEKAVASTLRRSSTKLGFGMNFGEVLTLDENNEHGVPAGVYLPWAKTAKRVTAKNAPEATADTSTETA